MAILAGALLGVSAGIKIWGVVVVLAVLGWMWVTSGPRRGLLLLLGSAAGVTAICLPFFISAPATMWRMVVLDQLGRPRSRVGLGGRLVDMIGWPALPSGSAAFWFALGLAALACGLAARSRQGQLALVVLVPCAAVLVSVPSWFVHYAGWTAAPAALVVGAAVHAATALSRRGWGRRLVAAGVVIGLLSLGWPLAGARFGRRFPGAAVAAATAQVGGCVTTDDPTTLIEANLLRRNLDRGCPLVVDLGGYSYDGRPTSAAARRADAAWQRLALRYLGSGSAVVVIRFRAGTGFSSRTAAVVHRWRILAEAGPYVVRSPDRLGP